MAASASSEKMPNTIPEIFCWTKIGTEGGQSIDEIVWRKELERGAGNGTFFWGIGNSLGNAPVLARQAIKSSRLEVLFTLMKSRAKTVDQDPPSTVLWLTYIDDTGHHRRVPDHVLLTSRGVSPSGESKHRHYALVCTTRKPIRIEGQEVINAARTRNLGSANPVGSSQVTAVVTYDKKMKSGSENLYRVAFRADLTHQDFVRLSTPVALNHAFYKLFFAVSRSTTSREWLAGAMELKSLAWRAVETPSENIELFSG